MKKNIFKLVLIPFMFLVGCSSNAEAAYYDGEIGYKSINSNLETDSKIVYDTTLKVYYEVSYKIWTKDIFSLIDTINNKNNELGGYLGDSTRDSNYATFIYRVPTEKLDEFIDFIDDNEGVSTKQISTYDVTSEYSKYEAELEILESSKKAYLKMLEEEDLSLEDIILLQEKISDINVELLTYSNKKEKLDNKIDYSTVTIYYYTTSTYDEPSWFSEYFSNLADFFMGLGKAILYFIPIGGTFAIVGFVIYLPVSKTIKKRNRKQKEKEENN